jgi:uncharacterized membrane-anchored protein YhcB (DUF1043 family)
MTTDDLAATTVAAVLTAAASVFAGVIATWIGNRARKRKSQAELEIESIATTVRDERQHAVADTARIEALLKKELGQPQADLSRAVGTLKSLIEEVTEQKQPSPAIEALISGYHEQALSQSSTQFWFSVAAAAIGFAWILYTGLEIRAENLASALKTTPGIVLDAVAFLFFRQASETRQRATDLYDRLRRDKQTSDSISLVDSIDDVRVRSAVKAQMALHMAGLAPDPINLTQFVSRAEALAPEAAAITPAGISGTASSPRSQSAPGSPPKREAETSPQLPTNAPLVGDRPQGLEQEQR